jgi:DNA primase
MDENQHKAVLEEQNVRRWIKTNPAGWFGLHPSQFAEQLVLVEGGFDRLALLAAGLPANQVITLVGTAARPAWMVTYAPQVKRIILALDADIGGQDATWRLAAGFREVGLAVQLSPPPQDGWGKDWSERYRCNGVAGVQPLLAVLHTSLNS